MVYTKWINSPDVLIGMGSIFLTNLIFFLANLYVRRGLTFVEASLLALGLLLIQEDRSPAGWWNE